MIAPTPVAFEPVDLITFIQYIVDLHTPASTLIVCSTKEVFVQQLVSATTSKPDTHDRDEDDKNPTDPNTSSTTETILRQTSANPWGIPTLRLLASSRTVTLAFCPDVTHLRAYLAAYPHSHAKTGTINASPSGSMNASPILAILDPIQLHRPTSAFSAQGLNRTMAVAVDAAYRSACQLMIAECALIDHSSTGEPSESMPGVDDTDASNLSTTRSPWDEEVSILNVTTKTFGAGERGWVGRTVKIRAIAARWCEFRTLPAK